MHSYIHICCNIDSRVIYSTNTDSEFLDNDGVIRTYIECATELHRMYNYCDMTKAHRRDRNAQSEIHIQSIAPTAHHARRLMPPLGVVLLQKSTRNIYGKNLLFLTYMIYRVLHAHE